MTDATNAEYVTVSTYTKKPVEIQAVQWDGTNTSKVIAWSGARHGMTDREFLSIQTLEGAMTASLGDFIIRGVQGEFYPCKPDIFEATYTPATSPSDDAANLNALATTIRKVNNANGWTATDSTPTATIAVLALIMTEVAEAIEEVRNNAGDESRYRHAGGCAVSDWRMYGSAVGDSEPGCTCTPKPEGLPSEVADIIIRSLDFCASRGIDIDKAVAEKVAYNRTRSHRHGGKAL